MQFLFIILAMLVDMTCASTGQYEQIIELSYFIYTQVMPKRQRNMKHLQLKRNHRYRFNERPFWTETWPHMRNHSNEAIGKYQDLRMFFHNEGHTCNHVPYCITFNFSFDLS